MPYINQKMRDFLDKPLERLLKVILDCPISDGELNYIITKVIHSSLKSRGEKYITFNALIGVLECVKLEYYRRKVKVYEKLKKEMNGDV